MSEARRTLVTGVSSGTGEAISSRLPREGWQATGISRRRPVPAPGSTWLRAGLAEPGALVRIPDGISAPDAVGHAVGLQRSAPLGELSADDGELMWRVRVQPATILVDALADRLPDGARVGRPGRGICRRDGARRCPAPRMTAGLRPRSPHAPAPA